jgi:hypothetical protein
MRKMGYIMLIVAALGGLVSFLFYVQGLGSDVAFHDSVMLVLWSMLFAVLGAGAFLSERKP